MEIRAGFNRRQSQASVNELASYRHRVFVERLGWQLECENSLEFDQFDHDDTLYLTARGAHGQINGCARLLPTTGPYLLGDVFPELLNGQPLPSSSDVWELSRFAALDLDQTGGKASGQFSSPVAVGLLKASLKLAAERGAKHVVAVTHLGVERLLHRAGFQVHRAGPPKVVDGHVLIACWIPCGDLGSDSAAASRLSH
jgi:N-acyl-L-homoserine lactone synthetase